MPYNIRQDSYEEINQKLCFAIDWLKENDAAIKTTRISKYKKVLETLIDAYDSKKIKKLLAKTDFLDIVNSLYEINEIIDIWEGLRGLENKALKERLKKFIKGPEKIKDELVYNDSIKARNIGFELFLNSKLASSGFKVEIRSDHDIFAQLLEKSLFIECKRPQGLNNLKNNIDYAFKQLERKYQDDKEFGIIAISINKLVNIQQPFLVDTSEELSKFLRESCINFIEQYQEHWMNRNNKEKTLAVIICLQTPSIIKNKNYLLTSAHQIILSNTISNTDKNYPHFTEIFTEIENKLLVLGN